jgi:predicted TIM-barrel fold metal-dependent hydrolase
MLIIDSHVHLWATGKPSAAHRQVSSLTAAELIREMDEAGVDAAVIQPPAWDASSNEVAVEAARLHPERFAVLGWIALERAEALAQVEGWKKRPSMLGFRFTFSEPHQHSWPTDGTLEGLCAAAERAGLPVALACGNFLPVVGKIAARHPDLKLLVDHLGAPLRSKDQAAFANLPQLLALAKHPNIAVKASAAPGYSSEAYPFRNIHSYLRAVYDAFGPKRVFWGTDITRMPCTYRQCVTMFTEELPWLSAADKYLVMGRALCNWIGWNEYLNTR